MLLEAEADGDGAADPVAAGAVVGVLTGTVGVTCGGAEVAALVTLGDADGGDVAAAETLGLGEGSGDAEAALLIALAEGNAGVEALGEAATTLVGPVGAESDVTDVGTVDAIAGLAVGATGTPDGVGVGISAAGDVAHVAD